MGAIIANPKVSGGIVARSVQGTPGASFTVTGTGFVHATAGSVDPAARAVNLASNGVNGDVIGVTAVSNGGTGLSAVGGANTVLSSTGVALAFATVVSLISAGTVPITDLVPGSAAQLLQTNGTPAAAWVTASQDASIAVGGAVTVAGLLTKPLPALVAGVLQYTGAAWALSTVAPGSLAPGTAGQVMLTNATPAAAWTTLGGDLGTITGAGSVTVAKINGASVPSAGALTTGNVLQVSGASALTYAPVNLGGGSNFVTGTLPFANLPLGAASTILAMNSAGTAMQWETLAQDGTITSSGTSANLKVTNAQAGKFTFDSTGNYLNFNSTTTNATASLRSDGSTLTYLNAPTGGALALLLNNATFLEYATASNIFWGSSSAAAASWYVDLSTTGQLHAGKTLTVAGIFQDTLTADAAPGPFTVQAQSCLSTATTNITGAPIVLKPGVGATGGANGAISGNIDASLFAPTAPATTEGFFRVLRAGSVRFAAGCYPGSTAYHATFLGGTDAAHVALYGDGSTFGYFNLPSGGSFGVIQGGATFLLYATTTTFFIAGSGTTTSNYYFDISTGAKLHFTNIDTSAAIGYDGLASTSGAPAAGNAFNVTGQPGQACSTNLTVGAVGGTLQLNGGAGGNATGAAGGAGGNAILNGAGGGTGSTTGAAGLAQLASNTTTLLSMGAAGLDMANTTQTINTTGNTTLSTATLVFPIIRINAVTLTGAATITFPNSRGTWYVDISQVAALNLTLAFKSGTATSPTITALSNTEIVMVCTYGSNTISINA